MQEKSSSKAWSWLRVRLLPFTPEPEDEVRLTAEEEAELLEAIAEADRGETISAEELFARLDRIAKR